MLVNACRFQSSKGQGNPKEEENMEMDWTRLTPEKGGWTEESGIERRRNCDIRVRKVDQAKLMQHSKREDTG